MSEKRQCEALAQNVVDGFPEEVIKEIVGTARGMGDLTTQEQFESVFSSGLFEGSRLSYESMIPASQEIEQLLKGALEGCDKALMMADDSTDAQLAIADIRRPIALYLREQNKRMREALASHISDQSGIPPHMILDSTPVDEYPDVRMIPLGLKLCVDQPKVFGAFVLYHDDTSMQCRCISHLMERFDAEKPDPNRVKLEVDRKFRNTDIAMAAYARFTVQMTRAVLAHAGSDHFEEVSAISPTEAAHMAKDFIVKLAGKGYDGK